MTSARHTEAKKSLPVTRVVCRFVYEGEIKGEWVDLDEAMRTWMKPADGHTVDRVEFIEKERPPRDVTAGMPRKAAGGLRGLAAGMPKE